MDKQTLSNYGWIVICTLVVSVMIALASPFGTYIKDATLGTEKGLIQTNDILLEETLDATGVITSVRILQERYEFSYYSSFDNILGDVNNNSIGTNADANKTTGKIGAYIDENGKQNIVLLSDVTREGRLLIEKDVILNLGGKTLTFENDIMGINTIAENDTTIIIDGRLKGSKIVAKNNGRLRLIQVLPNNDVVIKGGEYEISATEDVYFVYGNDANVTVNNCKATLFSETNNAYGILNNGATFTVNNSDISTNSNFGKVYGVYNSNGAVTTLINTVVFADADYQADENGYTSLAIGVANWTGCTLYMNNCTVTGIHSGVQNNGNIYVNGGLYQSIGHGGFYFSGEGEGTEQAYVKNATIRDGVYEGIHDDSKFIGSNWAAFYIGGNTGRDNISVYMDNCIISGAKQSMILRGSSGEQNNTLYISNSTILTMDSKIRIDNDTHTMYIGQGCNFTAEDTPRPHRCIQTDEKYVN